MNKQPVVSIGMPVYNGALFIGEAIGSLLAQTYTDFELIISDNASTDATEEICRGYASSDARVQYVRQAANQGAVINFNCLVRLSRGEYFKWAASDDLCMPTYLQSVVNVLATFPAVVWCHSQSRLIDKKGEVLARKSADKGSAESNSETLRVDYNSPVRHRRYRGILLGTNWCADSYGVIRKSALQRTNLLPACYGGEKVLMGELALLGYYEEVPEVLFSQRVHAAASGNMAKKSAQVRYVLGNHRNRFASTRISFLLGHIRAVNHVSMSLWDRIRCYFVIGQYLFQITKWPKIINADLRGYPLGHYSR